MSRGLGSTDGSEAFFSYYRETIGTRAQREMPASTHQIMQAITYNNLHATPVVETFQLYSINKLFVSHVEIKMLSLLP